MIHYKVTKSSVRVRKKKTHFRKRKFLLQKEKTVSAEENKISKCAVGIKDCYSEENELEIIANPKVVNEKQNALFDKSKHLVECSEEQGIDLITKSLSSCKIEDVKLPSGEQSSNSEKQSSVLIPSILGNLKDTGKNVNDKDIQNEINVQECKRDSNLYKENPHTISVTGKIPFSDLYDNVEKKMIENQCLKKLKTEHISTTEPLNDDTSSLNDTDIEDAGAPDNQDGLLFLLACMEELEAHALSLTDEIPDYDTITFNDVLPPDEVLEC